MTQQNPCAKKKQYDTKERIESCNIWSEMIRKNIDLKPEMIIIDFGAGTGLVGINFLKYVKKVIFEDISESMLEQCRKNLSSQDSKNYEIFCGPIHDYKGENADIILASLVFHHIDDIYDLSKVLLSKLKPKGKLIICDFLPGASFFEKMKPNIPHLGFVPEDLSKILINSGFAKAEIKPANPISHIQDDGHPEFYERFSIYAEAP
ncbi:hypothetical protein M9Y10_016333 [Tritrichomonas musculus]|uniref:Methyltransferase domain-containing protein n=1 Tax=Tritrichomonas musculus TaxID=1915356 RepID=A0ABR2HW22_9EUKA